MESRLFLPITISTLALVWIGIQFLNYQDRLKDPSRLTFILNISELPSSVRDISCSSDSITDLILTCAFKVDPAEFDKLLTGWQFEQRNTPKWIVAEKSSNHAMAEPVGQEFDISVVYSIKPASFKHGGIVTLASDESRSLVIANRYEE